MSGPLSREGTLQASAAATGALAAQNGRSLAPGLVWAFCGDSITNGSNASNYVYSYASKSVQTLGAMTARYDLINGGKPGDRSNGLLSRMPNIIGAGAQGCVIMIGTNDAGTGVTPSAFISNVTAIISKAKAAGLPVVLCTVPPRGSAAASTIHPLIRAYNTWIRMIGPTLGCTIADVFSVLVDTTSGYLLSSLDSGDNTHPNDTGHNLISKVVQTAMLSAAGTTPPIGIIRTGGSVSTMNLIQDPLAALGTTQPQGWFEWPGGTGTAPTYSLVSDTSGVLPAGKWAQMDFDGTSSGGTRRLSPNGLSTSYWSVGDQLLLTGHIQIEDVSGTWETDVLAGNAGAGPAIIDQTGVTISGNVPFFRVVGRKNATTGYYDMGPIVWPFTIPSGTTALNVWFSLQLPTGKHVKMRVGDAGVLNLTQLGLNSAFNWGSSVRVVNN